MKTSELKHNALSFLISMIEMPHLVWGETIGIHNASNQIVVPELPEPDCYSPFANWAMFGPIIEREKISLASPSPINSEWTALLWLNKTKQDGPTPLIAAMRCFVASKLGDEVEIPELK